MLDKLIEAGLQVDIEKSEFHVQETAFLGVIVGINSIRMDPRKIQAIVDCVKICGNPDESRWNSLDPSGCSLAKVAGAEALAR